MGRKRAVVKPVTGFRNVVAVWLKKLSYMMMNLAVRHFLKEAQFKRKFCSQWVTVFKLKLAFLNCSSNLVSEVYVCLRSEWFCLVLVVVRSPLSFRCLFHMLWVWVCRAHYFYSYLSNVIFQLMRMNKGIFFPWTFPLKEASLMVLSIFLKKLMIMYLHKSK